MTFQNLIIFFKFNLFADDSTLSCKINSTQNADVPNVLTRELEKVHHWLYSNKILVSHSKSNFIIFSYRKSFKLSPIKLGNDFISQTDSTKFLGIILDEHLNFRDHINFISAKLSKTNGILYSLNKFFPPEPLKNIYQALIVPRITYGIEAWYGAPQFLSNRIEKLQKKSIRAIFSLPFNSHTDSYFLSGHLLRVSELFKSSLGIHMYNMIKNETLSFNSDFHSYNTRGQNNIKIPKYNREKTKSCWIYRGTHLWNTLPNTVRHSRTANKFKQQLKSYLLSL